MESAVDKADEAPLADREMISLLDRAVAHAGADPASGDAMLVREMMHTALKLVGDDADTGELKLISRSLKELRYAMKVFRPYHDVRKISIFGSARTSEDHPQYLAAVEFSKLLAEAGWMVITGAGDGIMRAGHGGAGREKSFGVSIRLPFETNTNEYILGDPKLVVFRYFFTRKLMFVWRAHAVALFPGGFGTQDEGFEALTLVQTGKAPMMPIVMIDQPGGGYWRHWDQWVRNELLEARMISPEDLNLYYITDQPEQAARHILSFYRNYHSQRFVNDVLILRMLRPLSAEQVQGLNQEFGDLIKEGRIEQGGPLPAEKEFLNLPRLHFVFTRSRYGRLRRMIDRINELDALNALNAAAGKD